MGKHLDITKRSNHFSSNQPVPPPVVKPKNEPTPPAPETPPPESEPKKEPVALPAWVIVLSVVVIVVIVGLVFYFIQTAN